MVRTRQITPQEYTHKGQVDSLRRGLEIMRLFNIRHRTLSILQIAEKLDLSRPTTEKLVHTLVAHGFLRHTGNDSFAPHASCLSLGRSVKRSLVIAQTARPLMQDFARQHDIHVTLSARDRMHMLVVEHCTPAGKVALGLTTGARFPIATSASGRAFLWKQPPEQRRQLLEELEYDRSTGAYRKLSDVYAAFEDLSKRGWCYVAAPVANKTASVATPLHLHSAFTLAAMTVGRDFTEAAQLEKVASALIDVAHQIDISAAA